MIGSSVIIGYSGFIGRNLLSQNLFNGFYNSENIESIDNKHFELAVCCAAPGTKWKANKNPIKDQDSIKNLMVHLSTINVNKFVLISTVDVYPSAVGVNEETPISNEGLHAYGSNRIMLEDFITSKFDSIIIRLPSIFGKGMEGGVLYDIIHKNYNFIPERGTIQLYDLNNLWDDIQIALNTNLRVLNIATEPINIDELKDMFGVKDKCTGIPRRYDMHSDYAYLWGKGGRYLYSKQEVLKWLKERYK